MVKKRFSIEDGKPKQTLNGKELGRLQKTGRGLQQNDRISRQPELQAKRGKFGHLT